MQEPNLSGIPADSSSLSASDYLSISDVDVPLVSPFPDFGRGSGGYASSSVSTAGSVAGDQDFTDESDESELGSESSESMASDDSDDDTEPTSILGVYPEVVNFFKAEFADVDMLIVHGFKVRKMVTGFPLSLITLSSEVTRHRGMTERATMEGGTHEILNTALYLGKFDAFQILIENISRRRQSQIKTFFLEHLQRNKSLYGGWVSANGKKGSWSRRGASSLCLFFWNCVVFATFEQ